MTDKQPKSLRLASDLYAASTCCDHHYSLDRSAASELERQHDELQMVQAAYESACGELRKQHALIAELVEALDGMAAMWVSVCSPRGWEPDHMAQHIKARAALFKAKEQ